MAAENDSKNKRGRTVETDRVNRILENEVFREHLGKTKKRKRTVFSAGMIWYIFWMWRVSA